jgi:hypothetical protein
MGTFLQAMRQHHAVAVAASRNQVAAAELWNAIVGIGEPRSPSAEAIRDTAPIEYAAQLATDDVAAAYALELFSTWLDTSSDIGAFELRDRARGVWTQFSARASSAAEFAEGFGWDLSSAWAQTRSVEASGVPLAEVQRIARLAGRLYANLRGAKATRVAGVPGEVFSVSQGNDLSRLLPSEQVLFADPILENVVLARIATRTAAQYAVRGPANLSKGPLVLALDESGSMHALRNTWSKAAAVAASRAAFDDNRPVSVLHYATSVVVQRMSRGDPSGMVEMVRHFLGGGTAIGLALAAAVDEAKELARRGDRGADVILITDGVDGDIDAQTEAFQAARALDVRVWTIAIECKVGSESPLRTNASGYAHLDGRDLTDERSARVLDLTKGGRSR